MIDPNGLRARARLLRAVRGWFDDHGYLEIPTPTVVGTPAMEEHLFALPVGDHFLRTSPELALKRVIAAGLPRVYEIGPCYRGRESGDWHRTEFTMIEWYRVGASLPDLMDDAIALIAAAAEGLGVAVPGPWRRVGVRDLVREVTGVDLATASPDEISPRDDAFDDAFFRRWVADVEPTLKQPTIVSEWPATQSALAQIRDDGEWPVAERFEIFVGGVEIANAFHELIDREEQLRRALATNEARVAAGEEPHPLDAAFLAAVGRLPPTSGIAMGLDRLLAALCGKDGIGWGRVE